LCLTCQSRYSLKKSPDAGASCTACMGIFAGIGGACKAAMDGARQAGLEFGSFSVSSTVPQQCDAFDFSMLKKYGYAKITPIKNAINREAGKTFARVSGVKQQGKNPEAVLRLDFRNSAFSVVKTPAFVFGRYEKLEAGLSQTKWLCAWCNGRGCGHCGMRGTRFEDSVHQQIEAGFAEAGISGSKLHGSGREDVDVRNIGGGRPFVIELERPAKRRIDLGKVMRKVNLAGKVRIHDLAFVGAGMVEVLKNSRFDKNYHATVGMDAKPTAIDAQKIESLSGKEISQQTPTRVMKRRADKVRKKKIFAVLARVAGAGIESDIFAECGTYIKELVSSDNGRTSPSFASAMGKAAACKELVMTGVQDNYLYSILAPRKWKRAKPA